MDKPSSICSESFSIKSNIYFPSENIFTAEFNFKKGDDIQVVAEKFFLQDGIPLIYIDKLIQTAIEVNNEQIASSSMKQLSHNIKRFNQSDYENISKKWIQIIDSNTNISKIQKFSIFTLNENIREKFTHIMLFKDCRSKITDYIRKIEVQDQQNLQNYNDFIERLNKNHSEEIEILVQKNKADDLETINNNVKIHLARLELAKEQFRLNFESSIKQSIDEFIDLINEEYKRIQSINITELDLSDSKKSQVINTTLPSLNHVNTASVINKDIIQKYKIELMLGLQNKRPFKLKIKQINAYDYLKAISCISDQTSTSSLYIFKNKFRNTHLFQTYREKKLKFPLDSGNLTPLKLSNSVYGINLTGLISATNSDANQLIQKLAQVSKTNPENTEELSEFKFDINCLYSMDSPTEKILKSRTDLHFKYYREQLESIIKLVASNHNLEEPANSKIPKFLTTMHSNIGKINCIYHVYHEKIIPEENLSTINTTTLLSTSHDKENDNSVLRDIFNHADSQHIQNLIIPLEFFMKGKFQLQTLKNCNEVGSALMKIIRTELNQLAHKYNGNQALKKVIVLVPQGVEDSTLIFNKMKDILKNVFE